MLDTDNLDTWTTAQIIDLQLALKEELERRLAAAAKVDNVCRCDTMLDRDCDACWRARQKVSK